MGTSKTLSGLSNGSNLTSKAASASDAGFKLATFVVGSDKFKSDEAKDSKDDCKPHNNNGKPSNSKAKYLGQLRSLNEGVSKWIKEHVDKNPYCILSPIFKDYEKHLAEIEKINPDSGAKVDTRSDGKPAEVEISAPPQFSSFGEYNTIIASSLLCYIILKGGLKPC